MEILKKLHNIYLDKTKRCLDRHGFCITGVILKVKIGVSEIRGYPEVIDSSHAVAHPYSGREVIKLQVGVHGLFGRNPQVHIEIARQEHDHRICRGRHVCIIAICICKAGFPISTSHLIDV